MREKLIDSCFKEFCNVAGDSPCGCDACPYGKYGSENGECYEEYKKDKLNALKGVTIQKWIPVSERLPEEGQEVLALCWHHEAWQPFVCYLSPRFKGRWVTSIAGQWMMNVSHWMPLPEIPKEEM